MGKKQQGKDEAPRPQSVVNREVFQRLNFLYQASAYLNGLEASRPVSKTQTDVSAPEMGRKRRKACLGDLGSSYVQNMRTIGNKTVVRMDPNVKRTLCKGCDTVLVPGTTASVRVKGSSSTGHKVVYTCLECRTSRMIPAPSIASAPSIATDLYLLPAIMTSTALQEMPEGLETPTREPSEPQNPRRRKRKRLVPRSLPLFARQDAGHIVFRGNEVLNGVRE